MKSEGRMATGTRRRYTEDFKQEAVRLVRDLTLPRFYRHLAKEENDEIGGSHGNRHTTAVYRRL
jgi:hypothetical protein